MKQESTLGKKLPEPCVSLLRRALRSEMTTRRVIILILATAGLIRSPEGSSSYEEPPRSNRDIYNIHILFACIEMHMLYVEDFSGQAMLLILPLLQAEEFTQAPFSAESGPERKRGCIKGF